MELYEVMRMTFSAREFTDDPVPDELLHRIFEHARFASSGGNRQGGHVIVVRDPETKAAIGELAAPAAKRYVAQRANGESPWNPLAPPQVSAELIEATEAPAQLTTAIAIAPVLLLVCVDLGVVAATDQHLKRVGVISGASIYPMVWNILLAARSEGYGGTLTTMPVAQESKLQALLGIPEHVAVAAVIPLGKPVKQLTRLTRRPVEEFTHLERWDGGPLTV
jgi:nitroreductase